jgi:hypothetical protein
MFLYGLCGGLCCTADDGNSLCSDANPTNLHHFLWHPNISGLRAIHDGDDNDDGDDDDFDDLFFDKCS